jgi:hypothetical protein
MIQFQHGIINSLEFSVEIAGAGDLAVAAYVGLAVNGIELLIPATFNEGLGKHVAEIPALPVEENAAYQIFTEVRIGSRFYRPYGDTCMFVQPFAVTSDVPCVTTTNAPADVAVEPVRPFAPFALEAVEAPVTAPIAEIVATTPPTQQKPSRERRAAKVAESANFVKQTKKSMSLATSMELKSKSDAEMAEISESANRVAASLGESLKGIVPVSDVDMDFSSLAVKPSLKK